jgi:hypothetical protein
MKKYFTVAGLFTCATLMVAAPAMARVNVDVHIGVPGVYVQPAPVYVEPQPVYVQPQPVYVQPQPVYVQPYPVYVYPRPVHVHPQHSHGVRPGHFRDGHPYSSGYSPYGDRDRDGIPNRWDYRPHNPYRH